MENEITHDIEDTRITRDEPKVFEFMQTIDIAELSKSLCKAQGVMTGAVADSTNPFLQSKYADLASVWDCIRKPFLDNGLSVIQMPSRAGNDISLTTQITHDSGQWIRSRLTMTPLKHDPQSIGALISYMRRYALAAMVGIYQVDNDGGEPIKTITEDQALELHTLISDNNLNRVNIMKWLASSKVQPINSIEEIPADKFDGIKKHLMGKVKK